MNRQRLLCPAGETRVSLPENQRQEYLRALGIESYFPRVKLPGAPVSELREIPAGDAVQTRSIPEQQETARPVPEPVSDSTPTKKEPAESKVMPDDTVSADAGKAAPAQGEEPAPARDEIRFRLVCIKVNDSLAVINTMPHLGTGQLSGQHKNLLLNLLRSAGLVDDGTVLEEKPFRWPLVQGDQVDSSREAAAAALKAFLQQNMSEWKSSHLLIMGEQVIRRVFAGDSEQDDTEFSLEGLTCEMAFMRSIDEMLQNPRLKKEAWTVLKNLRT